MKLLVLDRLLEQGCSNCNVRSVKLNHKLTEQVQMDEDGECSEPMLEVHKCPTNSWGPCEQYFGRSKCRERSRQGDVALN